MSANNSNSGPAFACAATDNEVRSHLQEGISMLDYFAAKVMQTHISNSETMEAIARKCGSDPDQVHAYIASASYMMARAMLAEREK